MNTIKLYVYRNPLYKDIPTLLKYILRIRSTGDGRVEFTKESDTSTTRPSSWAPPATLALSGWHSLEYSGRVCELRKWCVYHVNKHLTLSRYNNRLENWKKEGSFGSDTFRAIKQNRLFAGQGYIQRLI